MFTYSQRKKLQARQEAEPGATQLEPETLDSNYAENMRRAQREVGIPQEKLDASRAAWMAKLDRGDYSGPTLDPTRFIR